MAITFGFFHDTALTQPIDVANPLLATQDTAGSVLPDDKTIYLGSPVDGFKVQVNADPGVTPISISVADSNPGGGSPASEIKLALSLAGLETAVAGDPLVLSATINTGVANRVPVYVRRTSAITTPALYTDITLTTQELNESPV